MGLTWQWSRHLGTVERTDRNGQKYYTDLYRGNALIIEVWTDPETDCYSVTHFWCDADHAKRCIADGLESFKGSHVRFIMSACLERYKKAEFWKLCGYILDSGGSVELMQ